MRDQTTGRGGAWRLVPRLTRYTLVSAICLAIQNVVLISSDYTALSYQGAILLSTAILIPTGYLLQAFYTFSAEWSWAAFLRYAGALSLNVPLSMALAWVLCGQLGLPMLIASPAISICLYGWNFLSSTWALDRPRVRPAS